jgi:hypothetical protein
MPERARGLLAKHILPAQGHLCNGTKRLAAGLAAYLTPPANTDSRQREGAAASREARRRSACPPIRRVS